MEKAKYLIVKDFITKKINDGSIKPEEKIPSENELAKRFDISRQTARHALLLLEKEGYVKRIQGKGTFVSPGAKPNTTFGVMLTYIDEYIFPEIIKGMDEALEGTGYTLALFYTNNTFEKERECIKYLFDNDIKGMLLEPSKSALDSPNIDLYNKIQKRNIPHVFIHALPHGIDGPCIIEDDKNGGYMAARHLIDKGHQKILGVFKNDDTQGIKRYEGYKKAHYEAGMDIDEENIIFFDTEDKNFICIDEDVFGRCSAAVAYNDEAAIQIISFLNKLGRSIPDDFSLVSFDDSKTARTLGITSIWHPKNLLGRTAIDIIIGDSPSKIVMQPEMIQRNSVKEINKIYKR